jgi:ABC-type lipoprotein export system ATPase subunit
MSSDKSSTVIQINDAGKTYSKSGRAIVALPRMSTSVEKGEFLGVRGPSGSGKTTLLLMLGGMVRPTYGQVVVDGTDIYGLSIRQRGRWRARAVGFVFQMFHLVPYANVLENVLTPSLAGAPVTRQEALALLDRFGLSRRVRHRPSELSTGERQRVAIARALVHRPPIALVDEPTGNLDPASAAAVMDHLADYHRHGGTVVLVTHETLALEHAQRVIELKRPEPEEET